MVENQRNFCRFPYLNNAIFSSSKIKLSYVTLHANNFHLRVITDFCHSFLTQIYANLGFWHVYPIHIECIQKFLHFIDIQAMHHDIFCEALIEIFAIGFWSSQIDLFMDTTRALQQNGWIQTLNRKSKWLILYDSHKKYHMFTRKS